MDNKKDVGSPDSIRINVNEGYELTFWSNRFNVSPEELKAAVASVGTFVKDVEEHLRK
jgi:hypothetical protein